MPKHPQDRIAQINGTKVGQGYDKEDEQVWVDVEDGAGQVWHIRWDAGETMTERAARDSWKHEPLFDPQPIPAPHRVWTDAEMSSMRLGYVPQVMEEKWFIFMEENRLFVYRSWTGFGIYEAAFASTEGGHIIESAVVCGDNNKWQRSSDEEESAFLESLIVSHLLRQPLTEEQAKSNDPFTNWELTVPTLPKKVFYPKTNANREPE